MTSRGFVIPEPPEELSYVDALADPMQLPLKTRAAAAHHLMDEGTIDGWQALAFIVYGVATIIETEGPLPTEDVDENGDWIIGEDPL